MNSVIDGETKTKEASETATPKMELMCKSPRLWRCYDEFGNTGEGETPTKAHSEYVKHMEPNNEL